MEKTSCYSITVKKFNVFCRHTDWLRQTQELYNEILGFYYELYLDMFIESTPGAMEALRTLEKMTIIGRDKQPVPNPLPWTKVPLYFRRAAINAAIAAARSYRTREAQNRRTQQFTESVTFYKGMYRDFNEKEITLKIWNGTAWKWTRIRLYGNSIPETGVMMSPSLVLKRNQTELHIPWKTPVEDGRTARERMDAKEKICAAVFCNQDACTVCCILDSEGNSEGTRFIRGGAEYSHRCKTVETKLKKSQASGGAGNNPRANARYWEKLRNLNDFYSHSISRQVIEYCKNNNAKIITLPEFDRDYSKIIMTKAGNHSPIHLSTAIREKIKYKAWQEGIVVVELQQHEISSVCSICGETIKNKGNEFFCPNGHRGNRYLNTARNLGKKCLKGFEQNKEKTASKTPDSCV